MDFDHGGINFSPTSVPCGCYLYEPDVPPGITRIGCGCGRTWQAEAGVGRRHWLLVAGDRLLDRFTDEARGFMPACAAERRPSVVIAEFGGGLHLADGPAGFAVEHPGDGTVRLARLTCDCGASAEWDITTDEWDITTYDYLSDARRLTVVHTHRPEPICPHWNEIPLAFTEAAS